MVKLTAIQLCSTPSVEKNLAQITAQLQKIAINVNDEHLVLLPECCLFFGGKDSQQFTLAQQTADNHLLINSLSALAKQFNVYLIAGTIPLLAICGTKFTNTSCVFSPSGELLTEYHKIHLFDVIVADKEKNYCESRYTQAGNTLAVADLPFAKVGLSVCYDIRFPELYRQLRQQGVSIITVPSAFTKPTGKAHWQTLLQARAIENQVYIIAAGQEGVHENGRETWGHSMIISPWGEVLTCLEQGIGSISTTFDAAEIQRVRASMPVNEHNRFTSELK